MPAAVQEFNTVDVMRLEVETDPTGLVNLVQNPSGELGGWGWITSIANTKIDGSALGLTYTSNVMGASNFTTEDMPISAGQYAAARWNALSGTVGFFRARFEWINLAGTVIGTSTQTGYLAQNSAVGNLGPQLAPAGTVWARLRFDLYKTNAGGAHTGAHYWNFKEVTVAKAAASSTLGQTRTNLVPNPSFEVDTAGWSVVGGVIARSTLVGGMAGTASLAITPSGGGTPLDVRGPQFPVAPGATYTPSLYARADTVGGRSVTVGLFWFDAGGNPIYLSPTGLVITTTGSWQRASVTVTAPSGAAFAAVAISSGATAGERQFVDAAMCERAGSVGAYFDGATPDAGGWDYGWAGTPNASASIAVNSNLGYLDPVQYLNVIGESHELRIVRQELQVGRLAATIISRSLDPADSALIRPGRRARLRALVAGQWEDLLTGKLLSAEVAYELKDPQLPDEKRATIDVTIVDAGQPLANAKRPLGVATIPQLPFVLEGAGVPWNVNGSGNQVLAATPTTFNDNASALTQLALTRDTRAGFVWVSRRGVVNAWDRASLPAVAPLVLDESDYSDLKVTYGTDDCINAVEITVQALGADGGSTTETTYGPYEDATSIEQYGRFLKTFTVTGLSKTEADALAAAILAAAKTPVRRVQSVTLPLTKLARVDAHALIDLYDLVRVENADLSLAADLRVTGIEHVVSTKAWMVTLTFGQDGGVASPVFQPPVQSGVSPDCGVIEMFAGPTSKIPATKLLCDGSSKAVADYPYLFAVIGYTHGGSGAFFNVPNLVDRFPIGAGTKALGTAGGSPTNTHAHGLNTDTGRVAAGSYPVTDRTVTNDATISIMPPWRALNFVIRAA